MRVSIGGRAHNLANSRHITPRMVRDVLALARHYSPKNPGAYIGNLLSDRIEEAKKNAAADYKQKARSKREQNRILLAEADCVIDTMPDSDLANLIATRFPGLTVTAFRADPILRGALQPTLAALGAKNGRVCEEHHAPMNG